MPTLNEIFSDHRLPIFEAVKYEEMFGDIQRFLGKLPNNVLETIGSVRRLLKKNDRIVWFLRLWKVGLVLDLERSHRGDETIPEGYSKKLIKDYARKSKLSEPAIEQGAKELYSNGRILIALEHYLSLPVDAIQKHVFSFEAPGEILQKFAEFEKEWQSEADGAFQDDDAEIIISFPDNYAWVNTHRASCDKEADAMGHCGNSPRRYSNDILLSLRKITDRNGVKLHQPHLTFILDDEGLLGEMKGRANNKPDRKYHPYIVALLRHPIVHGIKGGGYLPENNFSINDLDRKTIEELLDEKPLLGGIGELYNREGLTPRVASLAIEQLDSLGIPTWDVAFHGDYTVVETWPNFGRFIDSTGDTMVAALLEAYEDGVSFDIEALFDDDIREVISRMNDHDYETFMKLHGLKVIPQNSEEFNRKIGSIVEYVKNGPYYDDLILAAKRSKKVPDDLKERIKERLDEYIDEHWSFYGGAQYVVMDRSNFDSQVELRVATDDLMSALVHANEGYDDYSNLYLYDIRHHGWSTLDGEHMEYRREEAGLSFEGTKLTDDPEFESLDVSKTLDYVAIGREFMDFIGREAGGSGQMAFSFDD